MPRSLSDTRKISCTLSRSDDDDEDEPFDPDKPPTNPPEILDVFENQRYISKLLQWGLEASKRERSRPHLVARDDDDPEGEP